jgi:hypothetical protein
MPSTYNLTSFRTVCEDATAPSLVRAYCGLMVIELAVKDLLNCHGLKHDLQRMLQLLGRDHEPAKQNRAALNSLTSQLSNLLSALPCQSISNTVTAVRPAAFPDLRYVRHEDDWRSNFCLDNDLETLRRHIDQLRHFLRKQCLIKATA